MIIGETPAITFKLDPEVGINLNDAAEIIISLQNNRIAFKQYKLSESKVEISTDGTTATAYLLRADSLTLVEGTIQTQLMITLPEGSYPNYAPDGYFQAAQVLIPVHQSF